MGDDSKGSSERLEIFRAIERIANKQKSVIKAIKILREGSYAARMRGIKSETWRRYYYDWERTKACSKILADTMAKNQGLYRHHDDVKCGDVGINGVNVGINRSSKEENLVELIKLDGTLTAVRIAEMYLISTRQAERLINTLKRKGIIYREGSNKTGIWKVNDSSIENETTSNLNYGVINTMKNTKHSAPIATQCLGGVKTCIETAQNAAVRASWKCWEPEKNE